MSTDDIHLYYKNQIQQFTAESETLNKRKSSFAWLRLGSIGAIILAFYLLWQAGIIYVFIASVSLLIIFIRLVYADLHNHEKIRFTKKIIELYQKEIQGLEGGFPFANGSKYHEKEHPYSSDLDIFGENSLFQFLNRTTSEPGSDMLASYLNEKADLEQIHERQKAVSELTKIPEWTKRIQTFGTLQPFSNHSKDRLNQWISQPNIFLPFRPWGWLRYVLPTIAIITTLLFMNGNISITPFLAMLLVMAVVAWQINKDVAPIHRQLDEISRQLGPLFNVIEMIESQKFESSLLLQIQKKVTGENAKASEEIKKLKKLLDMLDVRYNWMFSPFLNLLLQWNLQQILDLEKWKTKHQYHLSKWVIALAEIETLNSLATFSFNNPSYIFPEVTNDYFSLEGEAIGHPLIPENRRVNNPVSIPSSGQLMLVTGSNMAGKSTYLRSVGVNCVLAFCGAPVCASKFRVSLVSVLSSMRIADNLQESTSTFYAELKKLKMVIDRVNNHDKVLILLDEILRGTNSFDRHTGSKALIKQLINENTAGIVATHDLELAELKDSFSEHILNYHFDVQVADEELYFDYKLKPGVCQSMNASILMKKIGIRI